MNEMIKKNAEATKKMIDNIGSVTDDFFSRGDTKRETAEEAEKRITLLTKHSAFTVDSMRARIRRIFPSLSNEGIERILTRCNENDLVKKAAQRISLERDENESKAEWSRNRTILFGGLGMIYSAAGTKEIERFKKAQRIAWKGKSFPQKAQIVFAIASKKIFLSGLA